jgi:site-specific DNA-methyltransferase (adenine-specific)
MVRVEASVLAPRVDAPLTAPATEAARQWQGWGTALKPALEPITMARKPLAGTVAANVLEHGTGAINVDGCRVGTEATITVRNGNSGAHGRYGKDNRVFSRKNPPGRWPANLIHDGSEEPAELLGTAARFFYCAKASRSDRGDGNGHPTVKPTELMRYLCRLVTPPGGTVLDPFAGSGSTGKAAALEGFRFIGIEREAEYVEIARARIAAAVARAGLFERTAS